MHSYKTIVIHEKNEKSLIKKNLSTSMKIEKTKSEYSLKQNFFDPSKSSPPNDFMNKLEMRMNVYNANFCKNHVVDIMDDSLDNE
jgi:hypothetical protein